MTHQKTKRIALLAAAGLSLGLALQAQSAWGQTATNLICNGCVQGTDIQNGTIGPNKLIPGSINATTIANGVIGPNKLIPGSINTATIATNAITSAKILNGAVKSVDIGDGEVNSADIQNSSILGIDIAPNTITAADIATNGVGAAEIAAGAVGQSEIATNGVGSLEIASSAVLSSEVANGSLFDFDLFDEAGADGVNIQSAALAANTDVTVATVVITAPTSGAVIVNASGSLSGGGAAGITKRVNCSLTRNSTSLDGLGRMFKDWDELQTGYAMTEFFNVPSGTSTFRLVCRHFLPGTGALSAGNTFLNALFVPTVY